MRETFQSGISKPLLWGLVVAIAMLTLYWAVRPTQLPGPTPRAFTNPNTPQLFKNHSGLDFAWPPKLSEPFPNLELISHTGDTVRLSDFQGKVVLVEPIGMTCAACNAFSGARVRGGYENIKPQENLPSIEKLLPTYAQGQSLDDDRIVLVQLLLYDMNLHAPSPEDAREWAKHFGFDRKPNIYVLAADERFINKASYDMIPGFFLLDKNMVLRADATGHHPKHNLFTELLAKIPELLIANAAAESVATNNTTIAMSMSVADAYRAIPHQQTTFAPDTASMPSDERRFVESLFKLTDIAVAERVQSLHYFQTRGQQGSAPRNYSTLVARLDALNAPGSLTQVKTLVTSAITEQKQYFSTLDPKTKLKFNAHDPLVQSSHRKLIAAYQLLMSEYPSEDAHNKKSFFDHLCALDFI